MDQIKAKQQVVEKIKENSKILVTVSDNPSVDALSAALALTMILDKKEKYATAIFSGETPPAIAFLEPEKTFDDTTDSLRDFIIAFNKDKADHLRYKRDGDSVKIFITPYKSVITQEDFEFSQGDYNVELIIALGVNNQDHLDHALEKGGQILHDATIITVTAGEQTSDLGGIDWHDADASSLSEMIAGLAEAIKENKSKPLIDESIATALLTGIVAETDRFSNEHTSSRTMTVAGLLMSAGANQQLIANELVEAQLEKKVSDDNNKDDEGGGDKADLDEADDSNVLENSDDSNDSIKSTESEPAEVKESADPVDATLLSIEHDETLEEVDRRIRGEEAAKKKIAEEVAAEKAAIAEREQKEAQEASEASEVANSQPASEAGQDVSQDVSNQIGPAIAQVITENRLVDSDEEEPTFGGTLNATTDQAAEDARRDEENDKNKVILSHSMPGSESDASSDVSSSETAPVTEPEPEPKLAQAPEVAPTPEPELESKPELSSTEATPDIEPVTATELGATLTPAPLAADVPAPQNIMPSDLGLPLPPPVPDFSTFNTSASLPPAPDTLTANDTLTNAVPAENSAYAYIQTPVSQSSPASVDAASVGGAEAVMSDASSEAALDAIIQPPIAMTTTGAYLPPVESTDGLSSPQVTLAPSLSSETLQQDSQTAQTPSVAIQFPTQAYAYTPEPSAQDASQVQAGAQQNVLGADPQIASTPPDPTQYQIPQ